MHFSQELSTIWPYDTFTFFANNPLQLSHLNSTKLYLANKILLLNNSAVKNQNLSTIWVASTQ